jgi:hypothetical protein
LASVGEVDLGATLVIAAAFDAARGHVVVTVGKGFVATYSIVDLAPISPAEARAPEAIWKLVYDASRDRFYGVANPLGTGGTNQLIVLDGATLEHVPGSPITFPAVSPASDVKFR